MRISLILAISGQCAILMFRRMPPERIGFKRNSGEERDSVTKRLNSM
jgi:hypothetical protein